MVSLKKKARELKSRTAVLFLAMKKKETPLIAKLIIAFTVIYALSPIDFIPDFIPVLGYLDDLILLPALIALSLKLIPKEILQSCEEEAKELWKDGKPKKWYYSLLIIFLWLIIIGIFVMAIT